MRRRLQKSGRKNCRWGEKHDKKATRSALVDTVKSLVLIDAEVDKLKNDDLNLELDCHREIEKQLESKAVARFHARGETRKRLSAALQGI